MIEKTALSYREYKQKVLEEIKKKASEGSISKEKFEKIAQEMKEEDEAVEKG